MRIRQFFSQSLIVTLLAGLSAPAAAGQVYDMGPLLDEPHPFAVPAPPPPRRPPAPGYSGRLYDMGPLLDEPHPFDVPPLQRQISPSTPTWPAGPPS